MRSSRYLFSESFNPWMRGVAALATSRHPLANGNPLIEREREAVGEVTQALVRVRETRDATCEQVFKLVFEQPGLLATLWRGMGPTAVNAPPSAWN